MKQWPEHIITLFMILFFFRLPRERIQAFKKKRLKVLLNHAYQNVPYYRHLFDSNRITPGQINGMVGLASIPISEKSDLRSVSRQNLIAKKVSLESIITHRTSGSTGEPFTMIITRLESWLANMIRFQIRAHCGRRIWDKKLTITYRHGDSQGSKALY